MQKTILFVDGEQFVHKALQRSFRKMRSEWHMLFATDPREAAQIMAKEPVDVLITETVFAGQSGLDLLKVVRTQLPQTVRIILSGYADRDVVLKSVDLAHQYLSKPCEDETLKATIARAFVMKELLDQEALKQMVSRIDALPSLPALYVELVKELESEDASIHRAGEIIAKDLGLTTRILKLVNSSYFGIRQHVSNPAKAVSLLGLDIVKAIVLTSGTFKQFEKINFPGFSLEDMWKHAMTTASFAKTIAQDAGQEPKTVEITFMAGLLHDIGKLLTAAYLPEPFARILQKMQNEKISLVEAEMAVIGTTHASIGAYLLGLWGLPEPIIDAAAFHHFPEKKSRQEIDSLAIVHVANAFANAGEALAQDTSLPAQLDLNYLQRVGALNMLENWRQSCAAHIEADDA